MALLSTRQWLSRASWRKLGNIIPVSTSFRGISSHLTIDDRVNAGTHTKRICQATKAVRKSKKLPVPYKDRCRVIRTAASPDGHLRMRDEPGQ